MLKLSCYASAMQEDRNNRYIYHVIFTRQEGKQ